MPRLAFLFLTYDNPTHPDMWKKFFDGVDPNLYSIYVHPKYPEKVTMWRDGIIQRLVDTRWGTFSLTEALINMMEKALEEPSNTKLVAMSDSCIPVYNFATIYERLMTHPGSIMGWTRHAQYRWKSLSDPTFISYDRFLKNNTQGMVFNRKLAKHFLDHKYYDVFRESIVPDEHYFINVLLHDKFPLAEIENNYLTFANWQEAENGGASPKTYSKVTVTDVENCRQQGKLFFRKVAKEAHVPIKYILT